MRHSRPYAFNRTPKYLGPSMFGIDWLELYHFLENVKFKANSFLYAWYFTSWAPYWLCAIVFRIWPVTVDNCTSCVRKATDYTRRGPKTDEISKTARLGCDRCKVITAGLSALAPIWSEKVEDRCFESAFEDIHHKREEILIEMGWRAQKNQWLAHRSPLRFYSNGDLSTRLPDLVFPGGIARQSDSEQCFQLIRTWLEKCTRSHQRCRSKYKDNQRFLPSRLVDVHKLRLIKREQFGDGVSQYAALSHSWGEKAVRKQPIPKTRNLTLTKRTEGIAWAELTRSFQDAVIATRRLGLDYLWIDSLCIIQDSDEDWTEQSAQMAKIYGEATIVISATRSGSGDVGIFHTRPEGIEFSVADLCEDKVTIHEQIQHENFFIAHKPKFDREPLFARGWCYQERLLARRIVHFTEDEIVWECNEELDCECQGIKAEAEARTEGHSIRKEFKAKFNTLLHDQDEEERDQCWMHVIEAYSARDLSYESDRLPALSGMAQQVSGVKRSRYLSGMWESDLPNSLLWYLPMRNRSDRQGITRVPDVPSWAWPAVGTGVTPHYEKAWYQEVIATVRDVHCYQVTTDPFGKVGGGYIVLEAPVVAARFRESEAGDCSLVHPDDDGDYCSLFPDSYSGQYLPPPNHIVWCVGIEMDLREGHLSGFRCVVVRQAPNDRDFLRISQVNCPSRWAQRAEMKSIRII